MTTLPYTPFNVTDRAVGALNASITSTDTSLVLQTGDGGKFPTSNFIVWCEVEKIYVSSRAGDTCSTLTRGYGGTTAVSHPAAARVVLSFDKDNYQRINDNLSGHTHVKADLTDFSHTHPQGDITNLVSDLAAKEDDANKNVANGYAGLDGNIRVPTARLGSGTADTTTFLRGDQSWQVPSGGGGLSHAQVMSRVSLRF